MANSWWRVASRGSSGWRVASRGSSGWRVASRGSPESSPATYYQRAAYNYLLTTHYALLATEQADQGRQPGEQRCERRGEVEQLVVIHLVSSK